MDQETLFTAAKWDILKILEQGPKSPIEIAKQLGSGIANISQQLKLLELAGIVKTTRITNREKNKPRILYSLAGDVSYLIATSDNFVDKKRLELSVRNKVVLRIWFLPDAALRYAIEKAFWQLEPHLDHIDTLVYAGIEHGVPVLEYKARTPLPQELSVNDANKILLHAAEKPAGYLLFQR